MQIGNKLNLLLLLGLIGTCGISAMIDEENTPNSINQEIDNENDLAKLKTMTKGQVEKIKKLETKVTKKKTDLTVMINKYQEEINKLKTDFQNGEEQKKLVYGNSVKNFSKKLENTSKKLEKTSKNRSSLLPSKTKAIIGLFTGLINPLAGVGVFVSDPFYNKVAKPVMECIPGVKKLPKFFSWLYDSLTGKPAKEIVATDEDVKTKSAQFIEKYNKNIADNQPKLDTDYNNLENDDKNAVSEEVKKIINLEKLNGHKNGWRKRSVDALIFIGLAGIWFRISSYVDHKYLGNYFAKRFPDTLGKIGTNGTKFFARFNNEFCDPRITEKIFLKNGLGQPIK